ncbi:transmembrane protein adipocyte-associated 1-like [Ischnura elegans]|uniref:transmembrane protein adipocyte-associated 1-like n=1 Tax=Ischnura elegans TaxID=197161 RepID=UPI001ED889EB|nr:transmembrane protein adipocyte-associated 1-like [Ischnura elegans]
MLSMAESAFPSSWPSTTVPTDSNSTDPSQLIEEHFCKWILFVELGSSSVRAWDLIILIPNALFLLLLAARFNRARLKLRATTSPVFLTFYILVCICSAMSVARCVVSMAVSGQWAAAGDKVLWVAVRFLLLATEMSVLCFGLAFGHLESGSSVRHVLCATCLLSLAFSVAQGSLEVKSALNASKAVPTPEGVPGALTSSPTFHVHSTYPSPYHIREQDYHLFAHGGMLFWFISSVAFTLVYLTILILPWTRLRERLALPTKRSFYIYVLCLFLLDLVQSIGSGLLLAFEDMPDRIPGLHGILDDAALAGLCTVDLTSVLYFTLLTPLVYHTFLSEFFGISQPSILFSYKAQVDDTMEGEGEGEDTVSLPHHHSFSSLKTDSDYIYQNNSVYDSTQFDHNGSGITPVNALYAASLQSPDSITGYSIDSLEAQSGMNGGNTSINTQPPSAVLPLRGRGYQQD